MAKGWIKLHRKLFNNPILTRSRIFSDLEAWIWLITHANHDDAQVLIGADVIQCKRGDLITSQKKLCMTFRWGNSKLRSFLKRLQKCQMICYKTTTKLTQITIIKYDTYQSNQIDNKLIVNRKQIENKSKSNTNNNGKNVKNEKNVKKNNKNTCHLFDQFWSFYPKKVNKKRAAQLFEKLKDENKEKCIEGAKAYKQHVKMNKIYDQYIMHPSTFINGENWEDFIHGSVTQLHPDMYRFDSTGMFVVGFCSKCGSCESYEKDSVIFDDSRCCKEQILPDRLNKA